MRLKLIYKLALALLSALLLSFSWPSIGSLTPFIFISLVPLFWLEHDAYQKYLSKSKYRLFPYTYLSFLVFNILTTWWVWFASDFGAIAAIVFNALFMATVFQLFHYTRKKWNSPFAYASFPAFWIAWEWIHLDWDLSWPWLTLGNVFAGRSSWIQWYEFTGILGGSLWIILINLALFYGLQAWLTSQKINEKFTLKPLLLALAILVFPLSYSILRYMNYTEKGEKVEVVVVQPNIDPYNEKFDGLSSINQVNKMIDLARTKITHNTRYMVCPETAIPADFEEHAFQFTEEHKALKKLIGEFPQLRIVIGASTYKVYAPNEKPSQTARFSKSEQIWYDYCNTALHMDAGNDFTFYHKSKLVPGVEMMPFPGFFKHFQELAFNLGGTTGSLGRQDHRTAFGNASDSVRIAPIICYESIYGEFVGDYIKQDSANLFFIITNDGWWEDTPGYKQHKLYGSLRAIEHRKSIARSANTGISCFVNQRGDILQQSAWWVPDALRDEIHVNTETTFYTRFGDYIGLLSFYLSLLFGGTTLYLTLKNRKSKS